jgi:hypothetical protein
MMAAGTAIKHNLKAAERQIEIVMNDDQLLGRLLTLYHLGDRLAGVIHKGVGHHQLGFGFQVFGYQRRNNPPGVVPRILVFLPGIS